MYNYNYAYNPYNVPYFDNYYNGVSYYEGRPNVGDGPAVMGVVHPNVIIGHLNNGRQGHCFRAFWGNTEHEFLLIGFNNSTGMVQIIEDGFPNEINFLDIVGLQYRGIKCHGHGPGPGPDHGPGPVGNCTSVFVPGLGKVWICK